MTDLTRLKRVEREDVLEFTRQLGECYVLWQGFVVLSPRNNIFQQVVETAEQGFFLISYLPEVVASLGAGTANVQARVQVRRDVLTAEDARRLLAERGGAS